VSDEARLLRRVLEHPDDDGPRLVYADWLDERGDPRGEFIRLQLALARLPPGHPDRPDLVRRERLLTRQHLPAWSRGLIGIARRCSFRRGFVEAVTLPASAFVEHAEALFAAAPIKKVQIHDAPEALERLAGCVHLRRVRHLDLASSNFTDADLGSLLRSPHLGGIEALNLSINGLTDRAAGSLAAAGLTGLRELDLSHNVLRAPIALSALSQLQRLDLSHNEIGAGGLSELLNSLADPAPVLHLTGNALGDDGAAAWLQSPAFAATVAAGGSVVLAFCGLGPPTARALSEHAARSQFVSLSLHNNALGDDGLAALVSAQGFGRLRRLSLPANGITDAGALRLADSALFARLEKLDLRQNQISADGVEALWTSERRHPRLALDLADNVPPPPPEAEADDGAPIRVNWPDDD
jgi:uncharacterized protein (TIGR02996 family)